MTKTAKSSLLSAMLFVATVIWGYVLGRFGRQLIPLRLDSSLILWLGYFLGVLLTSFSLVVVFGILHRSLPIGFFRFLGCALGFFIGSILSLGRFSLGGLGVSLGIGLLFWLTSKKILKRSQMLTDFYTREIIRTPAAFYLFWSIVLTAVFVFTSLFSQIKTQKKIFSEEVVSFFARPVVMVLNNQFTLRAQRYLGEPTGQELTPQDRKEISQMVVNELIETTQEGVVRQQLGFQAERLRLDKIKVGDQGQINLWPAVQDLTPAITKRLNELVESHVAILPAVLASSFWLALQPWLLLIRLMFPLLIDGLIKLLLKVEFIKKVKRKETLTRLEI